MFDAIDLKVLETLHERGRISWADLAGVLGLSAPAAAERVHRLEQRGVIRGFTAQLDPEALGANLLAFIWVTLGQEENRAPFLMRVVELAEVQECHHVSGEYDYLLKVRCTGTRGLERLITDDLRGHVGHLQTRTTIVLSTAKESTAVRLPSLEDRERG